MNVWQVPTKVVAAKAAGTLICLLLVVYGWLAGDLRALILVGVAAIVLAAFTARDVIARVRLSADAGGITVVEGFAGRRRIAWHEIERIKVDERARYGLRTTILEIDTGDDIHLFSQYDLGEPVVPVAETLIRMRP
ncbi:PH domain-containing protein [Herbidospora galbida]|uniref:PH domain-containing protein n=1 Tax=Herbidospora galbida TaxID=2575442 RepID=A0A4U3M881_9ACTN|nr:PH domain-containing protein [Herbidospora galbida]TKK84502.1 PH domain-containing protein [Herbidospora galbida]